MTSVRRRTVAVLLFALSLVSCWSPAYAGELETTRRVGDSALV